MVWQLDIGGLGLNCSSIAPLGALRSLHHLNISFNSLGSLDILTTSIPIDLAHVYARGTAIGSGYSSDQLAALLGLRTLKELDLADSHISGATPKPEQVSDSILQHLTWMDVEPMDMLDLSNNKLIGTLTWFSLRTIP